jgi:hypothetical protein
VLVAGLTHLGFPKEGATNYENVIKPDKFLVIAHATPAQALLILG